MQNFWCDIDLNKLQENIKTIKENTDKNIIAVVKANAYGLGIEKISEFLDDKVEGFAVSCIDEARKINSEKDILILTPALNYEDIEIEKNNIIFSIDSEEILYKMNKDKKYRVQIYVDTGMNRFGIKKDRLHTLIHKIRTDFPNVILDGIYTHLHNNKNTRYTINQIKEFQNIILPFQNIVKNIHCLNSGSFLNKDYMKAANFTNSIRIGNILYGFTGKNQGYKKIFRYRARIVREYVVNKGEFIGYNNSYKTKRNTKIGVLDFGYINNFGLVKDIPRPLPIKLAKTVVEYIKPKKLILHKGKGIKIINIPNMNHVLIEMDSLKSDDILDIDMSAVTADSSIPKVYVK